MPSILSSATSGMAHAAASMDVIGHNTANVNTEGFKVSRTLGQGAPDAEATDGGRKGVALTTIDRDFSAASALPGSPLQFSIQDDAFYAVRQPGGETVYARAGSLSVDSAGNITAAGGRLLDPPVTLPEGHSSPSITSTGAIVAVDPQGEQVELGQVAFFRFINPRGLESAGEGLYTTTVNSGDPIAGVPGDGQFREILPGTIEGSNVELVSEFTSMITAQRAYQAASRAFRVGDEMLAIATDLTR